MIKNHHQTYKIYQIWSNFNYFFPDTNPQGDTQEAVEEGEAKATDEFAVTFGIPERIGGSFFLLKKNDFW